MKGFRFGSLCFVFLGCVCGWGDFVKVVRVVADADAFWGVVEVDEAVRREKDPTGGRGRNGCIGEMLEASGEKKEEVLESAV